MAHVEVQSTVGDCFQLPGDLWFNCSLWLLYLRRPNAASFARFDLRVYQPFNRCNTWMGYIARAFELARLNFGGGHSGRRSNGQNCSETPCETPNLRYGRSPFNRNGSHCCINDGQERTVEIFGQGETKM